MNYPTTKDGWDFLINILKTMISKELEEVLTKEGYTLLREIPGRGVCGLFRFIFTVGLCYGVDETGYVGRYCYGNAADAVIDILLWDGKEDPEGDWIKHKGLVEYSKNKEDD